MATNYYNPETTTNYINIGNGSSSTTALPASPVTDIKTSGQNNKQEAIQIIDTQPYLFEVWLYNQIDGQEPFQVPFIFIESVTIEESILDWNVKGSITFNNEFEQFDKALPETKKPPMIFRTDGRNRVNIKICPVVDLEGEFAFSGYSSSRVSTEDAEFRKKWEMNYDFVIYDVEDLEVPNSRDKKRKYYLYDERYQIFSERNIEWSTAVEGRIAQYEGSGASAGASGKEQCCRANYALRSLIKTGGINPDTNDQIKVGGGTIDKPEYPIDIYPASWEDGTDDNDIFYTSPAYASVMDDIRYVLKYCGTKEKGPAFLGLTRW
jgi:hypothetical protein